MTTMNQPANLDSLYQEIILDHYKAPHHAGLRDPFDAEVHHVNPTCGDEVTVRVRVVDGVVDDVSYDAEGCSISQAATSVLTDLVIGKPVEQAMAVHETFVELMQVAVRSSQTRTCSRTALRLPAWRSSRRESSVRCWAGWRLRMRPRRRSGQVERPRRRSGQPETTR